MPNTDQAPEAAPPALQHVSHSSIECFRESVPIFHARHVTREIPWAAPTPDMDFGTVLHLLALQPDKFTQRVAVAHEKFDRRTNAGKAAATAFEESNRGKIILTCAEYEQADAMARSLRETPSTSRFILADGLNEHTFFWTHSTGLKVKCRLDKLLSPAPGLPPLCLDVKTTGDSSLDTFPKAVSNYGYHRQAALYTAGLDANRISPEPGCPPQLKAGFVFLVVSKKYPYEAGAFELDSEGMRLGWEQNERALAELSHRVKTKCWLSRYHDSVRTVSMPRWSFYEK